MNVKKRTPPLGTVLKTYTVIITAAFILFITKPVNAVNAPLLALLFLLWSIEVPWIAYSIWYRTRPPAFFFEIEKNPKPTLGVVLKTYSVIAAVPYIVGLVTTVSVGMSPYLSTAIFLSTFQAMVFWIGMPWILYGLWLTGKKKRKRQIPESIEPKSAAQNHRRIF